MSPSLVSASALPPVSKSDADLKHYLETTNTAAHPAYHISNTTSFVPQLQSHASTDPMVVDESRYPDHEPTQTYPLYNNLQPGHLPGPPSGKYELDAGQQRALSGRQPGQFSSGDMSMAKAAAQAIRSNWPSLSQAPIAMYNTSPALTNAVPILNSQGIYSEAAMPLPSLHHHQPHLHQQYVSANHDRMQGPSSYPNYAPYQWDSFSKPQAQEASSPARSLDSMSGTFMPPNYGRGDGTVQQTTASGAVPFPLLDGASQPLYGYMTDASTQAASGSAQPARHLSINTLPSPSSMPQTIGVNGSSVTPPPSSLSYESSTPPSAFSTVSVSPPDPRTLSPPPLQAAAPQSAFATDSMVHKDSAAMVDSGTFLFPPTDALSTGGYTVGGEPSDGLPYSYADFIDTEFSSMSFDYSQQFESGGFIDEQKEPTQEAGPRMVEGTSALFAPGDSMSGSIQNITIDGADAPSPREARGRGRGRSRARTRQGGKGKIGTPATVDGTLDSNNDFDGGSSKKRHPTDVTVTHSNNAADPLASGSTKKEDGDDPSYNTRARTQSESVVSPNGREGVPYRLRASSMVGPASTRKRRSMQNGPSSPLRQSVHIESTDDALPPHHRQTSEDAEEPDAVEADMSGEGGDEAGSEYEEADGDSEADEDEDDDEYVQGRSPGRPRGRISGRKGRRSRGKSQLSAAWALQAIQSESHEPVLSQQLAGDEVDDMDVDAPSMFNQYGKARRKRSSCIPLPVPVPNLTKKSRGRKVPSAPFESGGQSYDDVVGESSSSGYLGSGDGPGDGGVVTGRRGSRGRRVPTTTDGPGIEDRPFVCQVAGCGKRFVRGEHLKRHVRSIHTYDKPFVCPYRGCGKTFSRRDNLGQHARVHV